MSGYRLADMVKFAGETTIALTLNPSTLQQTQQTPHTPVEYGDHPWAPWQVSEPFNAPRSEKVIPAYFRRSARYPGAQGVTDAPTRRGLLTCDYAESAIGAVRPANVSKPSKHQQTIKSSNSDLPSLLQTNQGEHNDSRPDQ